MRLLALTLLLLFFTLWLFSPRVNSQDQVLQNEVVWLDTSSQRNCLAKNIYFESANQPLVGRVAVANVTLNRVNDDQFPNDICSVVYQARLRTNWKDELVPIIGQCQFSWYCDGKSDRPTDSKTWVEAVKLAGQGISGFYPDLTEGALWYHADYISPNWSQYLERTVTIENHLFYR